MEIVKTSKSPRSLRSSDTGRPCAAASSSDSSAAVTGSSRPPGVRTTGGVDSGSAADTGW